MTLHKIIAGCTGPDNTSITISYREICERIGLYRYDELAKARHQLSPAHRELRLKKAVKTALWSGETVSYDIPANTGT